MDKPNPDALPPRRVRGFTLIELMIVVAIVGVLASIAYPSFISQVQKSRRSDAVATMARVQQAQERWRSSNASYAAQANLAALGIASTTTEGGYYTIAISGQSPTGYTLTATAVAGKSQASDTGCTPLTITVTNGSPVYTPAGCWNR